MVDIKVDGTFEDAIAYRDINICHVDLKLRRNDIGDLIYKAYPVNPAHANPCNK